MAVDALGPAGPQLGAYPAEVEYELSRRRNRWWAFPVLGGTAKLIVLIPHFIILFFLGFVFSPVWTFTYGGFNGGQVFGTRITLPGLAFLILWIPVLLGGRMPLWGYAFVGGYLRWTTRVVAYLFGLTDVYPPFSMHSGDFPVRVAFHIPESNNRWWAFPIVAFYIKQLILIPHYVCLFVLGVCVIVLWWVIWIPVLISGVYPAGPYSFVAGVIRWTLRVEAFEAGLTDRYPPFSLA